MLSSRCYRHRFIHFFAVVLYFFQVTPSLQLSCIPSITTVHNVSHCPTSKQEWDVAARNKKCQNSVKQNCSVPELFKYHCLLTSDESTLVEVCAPEWKLNGYCPSFKTQDGSILHNFKRDCSNYKKNKCPGQYNSTEVYKFPQCYTLLPSSTSLLTTLQTIYSTTPSIIKSSQTSESINKNSTSKKKENQTEQHLELSWIVPVSVASTIFVIIVAFVLFIKCKEKVKCENKETKEETEIPLTGLTDNHPPMQQDEQSPTQGKEKPHFRVYGYPVDDDKRTGADKMELKWRFPANHHSVDEEFIAVSIDIGTTHTKWGFARIVNKSNKRQHSQITTNIEESVILFDEAKKIMAFGKKAIDIYLSSDDPDNLYFIRNYIMRMNLPTNQDMRMWRTADQRGCRYVSLLDVFTETIKSVMGRVGEMAEKSFPGVKTYRWILTYPAIWDQVAKDFLYEAAVQAGVPSDRLYLEMEHNAVFEWQQTYQSREKSKCLFIDLGGGSTKIYCPREDKETIVKMKKDSGGITIVKAFEKCLEELFSRQVLEAYKLNERKDYFKLFSSFIKKIHDEKQDCHRSIHFDVSKIVNIYKIVKDETLPTSERNNGVHLVSGKLEISNEKFKTFFDQCKTQIKSCISDIFSIVPGRKYDAEVCMFGWFLNSDIIFQYLRKEFQSISNLSIHKIRNPEFAIVKGAVILGGHMKLNE